MSQVRPASPPKVRPPNLSKRRLGAPTFVAQAVKLDRAGDLEGALGAYEAALSRAPDDPDILARLADLAGRMAMAEVAYSLWTRVMARDPGRIQAMEGKARALRNLGRFEEAINVLRQAISASPEDPRLWNSLGVTVTQDSQAQVALTFFNEALRLDSRYAVAAYNRGNAWFDLGGLEAAGADFDLARKFSRNQAEITQIEFAKATLLLARGELMAGWDAYETRLSHHWPASVRFEAPGRRWTPSEPLAERHLLVFGEQGLGDEIMFANLLPEVREALGPKGQLSLAVEPRLIELFRRSFPRASVTAYETSVSGSRRLRTVASLPRERAVDVWAPMGSLPRAFRRSVEAFPKSGGHLRADRKRVAFWRDWLGPGPPAVGVTWRSGKVAGERRRHYPPLDLWSPLVAVEGVRFVNLQYGECADDLARLSAQSGRPILQAPGLDLRENIDDLAALCVALDLIVSVSNATGALAGACGLPVVLLSPPASWPRLGVEIHPWFPSARVLTAQAFGDWDSAMIQAAESVRALAKT